MWHNHLIPLQDVSYSSIGILVTWPYHRTLCYFTLDPAARLRRHLDTNGLDLAGAINHWRTIKATEYDFVCAAVSSLRLNNRSAHPDFVQSTIAAAANIGIFSWTDFHESYWLAVAMLYFSLLLSLWGVITAAQHKSIIRALSVSPGDLQQLLLKTQVILRDKSAGVQGSRRSRSFAELNMLYVWQCPLM